MLDFERGPSEEAAALRVEMAALRSDLTADLSRLHASLLRCVAARPRTARLKSV